VIGIENFFYLYYTAFVKFIKNGFILQGRAYGHPSDNMIFYNNKSDQAYTVIKDMGKLAHDNEKDNNTYDRERVRTEIHDTVEQFYQGVSREPCIGAQG
jgi:hypothetical protein